MSACWVFSAVSICSRIFRISSRSSLISLSAASALASSCPAFSRLSAVSSSMASLMRRMSPFCMARARSRGPASAAGELSVHSAGRLSGGSSWEKRSWMLCSPQSYARGDGKAGGCGPAPGAESVPDGRMEEEGSVRGKRSARACSMASLLRRRGSCLRMQARTSRQANA